MIFNSIIHAYFLLFMLSQKKQTVIYLSTPAENVPTLTFELQNFSSDWSLLCSFKRWRLWKQPVVGCRRWLRIEPVVMCGDWNVRQAVSQQVFRVTILCIDTCFQSFSTLISRIVHHALPKFSPRCNKPQHVRINRCAPFVACPRCSTRTM